MRKVKAVKVDAGYLNALIPPSVRGRMTNYSAEMMAGADLLSEPVLQASYIHNGIFRTICDVPAEEMTRAGFKPKDIGEDEEQAIQSKIEELEAMNKLCEAVKWRNAFGGGLIVVGLNDGGALEDELDEKSINDIEFLKVYDRFECRPEKYYQTNDKNFGKVELWQINPRDGMTQYFVHSSRVLVFDGQSVPNIIRKSNDGWGASAIQTCFKQVIRLDTAYKRANDLLERMQQAVHKIPDLSSQVADAKGEEAVTKRVQVVDMVRGIYNTVIIDALEEYEIKSMSLTGVKDVIEKMEGAVSTVTRIPTHILVGKTEGSLSNNGESSKEAWYTQIGSWQIQILKKQLDRLVTLIKLSNSKGVDDGGNYTLEFNPLYTPSDKDQAEIDYKNEQAKKAEADALSVLMTNGVMDENEARDHVREKYNLKGDAPEPEEELPEPMVLNPGQKIVDPVPGAYNPALPKPVGKK